MTLGRNREYRSSHVHDFSPVRGRRERRRISDNKKPIPCATACDIDPIESLQEAGIAAFITPYRGENDNFGFLTLKIVPIDLVSAFNPPSNSNRSKSTKTYTVDIRSIFCISSVIRDEFFSYGGNTPSLISLWWSSGPSQTLHSALSVSNKRPS